MENKVNPKMLTIAREARGMTSAELAGRLGVTPAAAWYWEKEYFEVKDDTLEKIATILKYPVSFFLQAGDSVSLPMSYRKRGKVPVKVLNQVDAIVNVYRLALGKLIQATQQDAVKLPVLDVNKLGSPQQCALQLRKAWKVKKGPIESMSELLEANGIMLLSYDFATERVDGRCTVAGDTHPVIVTNRTLPGDRQRFTLAYHLGYLVMHLNTSPGFDRDLSHEANLFAAEFLMPDDAIKPELTDLNFNQLPELKKKWKASMISLLYRADDLGLISPNQKRYLLQQFNEQNIRRQEPKDLDVATEQFRLVRDLITKYKTRQKLNVKQLAEFFNMEQEEFLDRFKF
jgi:Zn-dependent peptidase ImmA (M78 family)/transcriptional regulator with XRE-family HTH domain